MFNDFKDAQTTVEFLITHYDALFRVTYLHKPDWYEV